MEKLKLNTEKILNEMKRIGLKKSALARLLDVYPSMVTYIFKEAPISYAHKIAEVLGMESRDLIK